MKVLVVNFSNRIIGGTEHYLQVLLSKLHERDIEVAFAHEHSEPAEREAIALPPQVPSWCRETLGSDHTLEQMRKWNPDIIFAHGELDPTFEARYLKFAPSIYFAHNYYGTCVSGLKTFHRPEVRPCHRKFGLACLAMYFPRQCGGMNPVTMIDRYRKSSRRLRVLRRYDAIVTHSQHLQQEYVNHGFESHRVHNIKYEVTSKARASLGKPVNTKDDAHSRPEVWRMMFLGRMERTKGGHQLIQALPQVQSKLGTPLHLSFAGDGPARDTWEQAAAPIRNQNHHISMEFHGWLTGDHLDSLIASTHLMVMPSLWPEPFGKSGLEAGLYGIPSAAFDVGGIGEWLQNGVNGHLAPGEPPTVDGLAEAIISCLRDPAHYRQLCHGSKRIAHEFNVDNHVNQVLSLFERMMQNPGSMQSTLA